MNTRAFEFMGYNSYQAFCDNGNHAISRVEVKPGYFIDYNGTYTYKGTYNYVRAYRNKVINYENQLLSESTKHTYENIYLTKPTDGYYTRLAEFDKNMGRH